MSTLPFAEDVNYWKTSRSSPESSIEQAKGEIEEAGGTVLAEAFGSDMTTGQKAYMLAFELAGDRFKVVWPVLPMRSDSDELAARRQAAQTGMAGCC